MKLQVLGGCEFGLAESQKYQELRLSQGDKEKHGDLGYQSKVVCDNHLHRNFS
jgi:hypothetical protein